MKTFRKAILLALALLVSATWASRIVADTIEFDLWPDGAPEAAGFVPEAERETIKDDGLKRLNHVSRPTMTVYKPSKANGTAILICPGGAYQGLAIEHEGTQVAEYMNSLGVTGIVLKYRVPRRDPEKPHEAPMADAIQALKLIQSQAVELGIKPDRVGMLGFSAGGNLCVMTALNAPPAICPKFIIPIYPAYLTQPKNNFELRPEIKVTKTAPPVCLIHADDDRITAAASALLYLEYKKQGIPTELHIYSKGGHGFGMKPNGLPVNQWQVRVADWLNANGWLAP